MSMPTQVIGAGVNQRKQIAKEEAAQQAIDTLSNFGWKLPMPMEYEVSATPSNHHLLRVAITQSDDLRPGAEPGPVMEELMEVSEDLTSVGGQVDETVKPSRPKVDREDESIHTSAKTSLHDTQRFGKAAGDAWDPMDTEDDEILDQIHDRDSTSLAEPPFLKPENVILLASQQPVRPLYPLLEFSLDLAEQMLERAREVKGLLHLALFLSYEAIDLVVKLNNGIRDTSKVPKEDMDNWTELALVNQWAESDMESLDWDEQVGYARQLHHNMFKEVRSDNEALLSTAVELDRSDWEARKPGSISSHHISNVGTGSEIRTFQFYSNLLNNASQLLGSEQIIIRVLKMALVAASPLTTAAIGALLGVENGSSVVDILPTVLGIVVDQAVSIIDPVFRDFLQDETAAGNFFIDMDDAHSLVARGCLEVMMKELEFNICRVESSSVENDEIDLDKTMSTFISKQLQYASLHWMTHLINNGKEWDKGLTDTLRDFTKSPYPLYWMEILSVLGEVRQALISLQVVADRIPEETTKARVNDIYEFLLAFSIPISESIPHIYVSAIPFAAKRSILHQESRDVFPNTLRLTGGHVEAWSEQRADSVMNQNQSSPSRQDIPLGIDFLPKPQNWSFISSFDPTNRSPKESLQCLRVELATNSEQDLVIILDIRYYGVRDNRNLGVKIVVGGMGVNTTIVADTQRQATYLWGILPKKLFINGLAVALQVVSVADRTVHDELEIGVVRIADLDVCSRFAPHGKTPIEFSEDGWVMSQNELLYWVPVSNRDWLKSDFKHCTTSIEFTRFKCGTEWSQIKE
ncbi:hypothetical protein FRC17_007302 [Serendipita sp. 399]|nr:hypothetical protein FRC17_007302 [Serendipita sp. 399]